MENAKGKEWNSTEKSGEECVTLKFEPVSVETKDEQWASSEPSTSGLSRTSAKGTKRKKPLKDDKASCLQENAPSDHSPKLRKKIAIPPLPSKLPPANLLHRDVLRAWCQQLKLSTKGQKLEAYKRLCEHAYPNQKDFPVTAKEAKILTQSQRKSMGEMPLEHSEKRKLSSEGTDPPEVAPPPEEGISALEESSRLEGENTVVVRTSEQEAVMASWTRTAARAGRLEAGESPQEDCDVRWCVVHGRSLPANTDGWVHLQFHAGQAWVPEKQGREQGLNEKPPVKLQYQEKGTSMIAINGGKGPQSTLCCPPPLSPGPHHALQVPCLRGTRTGVLQILPSGPKGACSCVGWDIGDSYV